MSVVDATRFLWVGSCFLLLLLFVATGCGFEGDHWSVGIPGVGSSSSPVATDLNDDGYLDIIIGAGAQEFTSLEASVIALDGRTGDILWWVSGHNQVVGTAALRDITGDGTDDVFIGGRSAQFKAIDGKTGNVIWEYLPYDESIDYVNDNTILNFYTAQWVPDADGDGVEDLLTAYGGFVIARRGDPDRPGGYLIILSGMTGKTIQKVAVPDGKETYMSPLAHDFGEGLEVIFGTGGETLGGNLYRVRLDSLLAGSLASSEILVRGGEKGMIAPPVLTDLTGDGISDIIVATVNGRLVAVDGISGAELWSATPSGAFDTYVMPAPAYFTGDDAVPDFFASFGKGAWPDTEYTIHLLIDGSVAFSDTLGSFQYASPVVADIDEDGNSDVLVCINKLTEIGNAIHSQEFRSNDLYLFPGGKGPALRISEAEVGTNLGSTPLLTDLDGEGRLDLITASMDDPIEFYSFRYLTVRRRELDVESSSISFGGYLGLDREGWFR